MAIAHTTGGEATGKGFYRGRHTYVEELGEKVDNSKDNLLLVLGPRRIGKTSIVKQFFLERNEDETDPGAYIYIYIPKIKNLVEFYEKAIDEINKSLAEFSKYSKLRDLVRGSRLKAAINGVQDTIKNLSIAGHGITLKDADKWEQYTSLVASLRNEFLSVIMAFEKKKVVLGFDEVPEAIHYLLKNKHGKEEVELWLEHLRELRHCAESKDMITVILFGSVNMKLTLEKIGQTKAINDNFNITVRPLEIEMVKELFWDLVDTLRLKILEDNQCEVNTFLEKMFTISSPWAIQNFLDEFRPPQQNNQLKEALQCAYLELFDIVGGVRYINERLDRYYCKEGNEDRIKMIKILLKYFAQQHVDNQIEVVEDAALCAWAAKELEIDRERYNELIDILLLDNMIYREGSGLSIKNTVERNFWYYRLVGSCKF